MDDGYFRCFDAVVPVRLGTQEKLFPRDVAAHGELAATVAQNVLFRRIENGVFGGKYFFFFTFAKKQQKGCCIDNTSYQVYILILFLVLFVHKAILITSVLLLCDKKKKEAIYVALKSMFLQSSAIVGCGGGGGVTETGNVFFFAHRSPQDNPDRCRISADMSGFICFDEAYLLCRTHARYRAYCWGLVWDSWVW